MKVRSKRDIPCRSCGRTRVKHYAKGRCTLCYYRAYRKKRRSKLTKKK